MNDKWLAGFIDAEGSFMTLYNKKKNTRSVRFSLGTTDYKTMSLVAKYLKLKLEIRKPTGQAKTISYHVRISGVKNIILFSNRIKKYLFTKHDCCDILHNIALIMERHIDNAAYRYTNIDKINIKNLTKKLKTLNKSKLSSAKNKKFSWEWFAGLIDGDGSINISIFTKSKKDGGNKYYKPMIKISMNDRYTIEYIANIFNKTFLKYTPISNKKGPTYTVRFLTEHIRNILPKIKKHLITKSEQILLLEKFMILKLSNTNKGINNNDLLSIRTKIQSINQ